jgi:MIP family channel proteins
LGGAKSAASRGLHGHPFTGKVAVVMGAEALGAFVLITSIICAAIAASLSKPLVGVPYGSMAVPLAGGFALASLVAALGPVSGAHFNPAPTVGHAVHGRFRWSLVPAYVLAQFVGAISASLVAWVLYGERARTVAHLGATYPANGAGEWRAVAAEAVVTFVLVYVVVSVAQNPKAPAAVSAMAIGFALVVAIFISGPVNGGAVNPARAVGPMLVAGKLTAWWVYIVGPLLGSVIAVSLTQRPVDG